MWPAAWGWGARKGTFHDCLFPIRAVGTEDGARLKPKSRAWRRLDLSHHLSNLLFAIHPPAQRKRF